MSVDTTERPRRVTVMGLAKSGTTAIAQTIANTLAIDRVIFEPKSPQEILSLTEGAEPWVMKMIFAHLRDEGPFLHENLREGGPLAVTDQIYIMRDPRGRLVSAIYYQAYEVFYYNDYGPEEKEAWLEVFREKERRPNELSMQWVSARINERFGKKVFQRRDLPQEQFDAYLAGVKPPYKLLRYEDFVAGTVRDAELAAMLTGERSVPAAYERVRRTEGDETWPNFLLDEDIEAINVHYGSVLERYGYPLRLPYIQNRTIDPKIGSDYAARLIDEAMADRRLQIERGNTPVAAKPYVPPALRKKQERSAGLFSTRAEQGEEPHDGGESSLLKRLKAAAARLVR